MPCRELSLARERGYYCLQEKGRWEGNRVSPLFLWQNSDMLSLPGGKQLRLQRGPYCQTRATKPTLFRAQGRKAHTNQLGARKGDI